MIYKFFNYLFSKKIYWIYVPFYITYKYFSESKDREIFKKYIHEGNVVIDAGANIGFYSIIFSKLVGPKGLVVSFEPDIQNFELLVKRTKNFTNIKCVNSALSDHSGSLDFFLSKDLNVDHRAYGDEKDRKKVVVKCFKLDEFLEEIKIDRVDFIKTDLQGYDPIAIRGMNYTLSKNKNHLKLLSEFWPWGMREAGIDVKKWIDEIELIGYKISSEYKIDFDKYYYTSILIERNNT